MSENPTHTLKTPHALGPGTLRNVLSNWAGFFFSAMVNLFLAPFVVGHLGNSLYGISVLVMSITGYLGLLDLGVRGSTTRYIARFRAQSKHDEAIRFTATALVIFGGIGLACICVSLALAIRPDWFTVPGYSASQVQVLIMLCGLNVAASLTSGVFSGFLMALQRFDYINGIVVLSAALRALAIVAVFKAGGGLIALLVVQLLYTCGATLACARSSLRLYPEFHVEPRRFDRAFQSPILSFSAHSFLLVVFDLAVMYLNAVVVGVLQSASMVTFFWIAASLINYSRSLASGISKTSTPQASALEAQQDASGLRRTLLEGTRYSAALMWPIAVTFMLRGGTFIGLWMGPEYAHLCGQVLLVLAVGLALSASNQVGVATMLGISKHQPLVPLFLGQALCNVLLSVALVRSYGVIGAAWGTTFMYVAVSLFFWPFYVYRTLGVSSWSYAQSSWLRPIVATLPFGVATYLTERVWPAQSLSGFFLQTGALLPLALLGFWYLCLTRLERQVFSQRLLLPALRAVWPRPV